jgi:hypothetical protein
VIGNIGNIGNIGKNLFAAHFAKMSATEWGTSGFYRLFWAFVAQRTLREKSANTDFAYIAYVAYH